MILSPSHFCLLPGNLHQLLRLLSEGAQQTQPQQDTQVGAAWGALRPLDTPTVHQGSIPTLGLGVPWAVAVHGLLRASVGSWQGVCAARGASGASSSLECVVALGTKDLGSPLSLWVYTSRPFLFLLCPSRVEVPAGGHCPITPVGLRNPPLHLGYGYPA